MATNARPSVIQLSDTVHLVPSKLLLQKLGQSFHHTSPVWSLDELLDCRELCYDMLTQEVVEDRYRRYGGIARNVFWEPRQLPSLKGALANGHACKLHPCCSRSVPNVHVVTYPIAHLCWRKLPFTAYLVLASRYVGNRLFTKRRWIGWGSCWVMVAAVLPGTCLSVTFITCLKKVMTSHWTVGRSKVCIVQFYNFYY